MNKTYFLPSSYGNGLTGETQSAFNTMAAAAKKDGLNIYISSGFRSYSTQKTNETGYIYEPWHFRYVGVELATKLYNDGDWITMEDYFGIDSKYE